MKQRFCLIKKATALIMAAAITAIPLSSVLSVQANAEAYWPESISVNADAAIVMEVNTGTVLYEKNSHESYFPASITKIMTALLAIENCDMDEEVTFSEDAVYKNEGSTSHIARDVGEVMTMEQCLYGMMLASANECAYAIGEHVADGDISKFVDMMNARAKELGCTDTHFNNPNGLPDDDHYVSAYDMALISRAAFQNEEFREICGTGAYNIPPTNKHPTETTYLYNHHQMLYPYNGTTKYLYDYCLGGKTGYTDVARSTLVTYAQKDGMTLVCVILHDDVSGDQYTDTINLFDYCFDNFNVYSVADYEESFLNDATKDMGSLSDNVDFIQLDPDGLIVLPKTSDFSDTTSSVEAVSDDSSTVARLEYKYGDRYVGGADLIFTTDDSVTYPFDNVDAKEGGSQEKIVHVNFWPIILIALAVAATIGLIKLIQSKSGAILLFKYRKIDSKKKQKPQYKVIRDSRRRRRKRRINRSRNKTKLK